MRRLKADEIECRVAQVTAKGCSLLLYKTARVDRAILDEAFGQHWQNDFKVIDGKMYGGIGIYDEDLKEWLWRWDCGTESNTEAEKGQASDCFKRAGFKWGIGVELYSAPFIFIQTDTEKNSQGKYQLKNKYTKYEVKTIDYSENGNINLLEIVDDKDNQVYKMGTKYIEKALNQKQEVNLDLDIISGLQETVSTTKAHDYYKEYETKVKDLEAFKKVYKSHYIELKRKEDKQNG